jgi:hypothetical protein
VATSPVHPVLCVAGGLGLAGGAARRRVISGTVSGTIPWSAGGG